VAERADAARRASRLCTLQAAARVPAGGNLLDFLTRQSNIEPWRALRAGADAAPSAPEAAPLQGAPAMSAQPRRRLEVEQIGDVTVVNFVDRKILDEQNIIKIGEQLFSLVDQEGVKKMLLNFANVDYLSSAALGKLITLNKKVQGASGKLVLTNIKPEIFEVFQITKLDKLFKIKKDEQEGLQSF
jgi:anti-sigma B factor antagonist